MAERSSEHLQLWQWGRHSGRSTATTPTSTDASNLVDAPVKSRATRWFTWGTIGTTTATTAAAATVATPPAWDATATASQHQQLADEVVCCTLGQCRSQRAPRSGSSTHYPRQSDLDSINSSITLDAVDALLLLYSIGGFFVHHDGTVHIGGIAADVRC